MDDFVAQKFLIAAFVPPQRWIGADPPPPGPGATAPVVTRGEMRDWSFRDGYLVLNDIWYSTHEGDQVVVRSGVTVGTKWVFIKEEGRFRIKSPDDNTFWTYTGADPKSKVTLAPASGVNPQHQLWDFIPEHPSN